MGVVFLLKTFAVFFIFFLVSFPNFRCTLFYFNYYKFRWKHTEKETEYNGDDTHTHAHTFETHSHKDIRHTNPLQFSYNVAHKLYVAVASFRFLLLLLLRLHTFFNTIADDGEAWTPWWTTTVSTTKYLTLWVFFGWSRFFGHFLHWDVHWGMVVFCVCESLMPFFWCLPLFRWWSNNRCCFNHCIEKTTARFSVHTLFNPIKINDMSWLDRRWKWALHYRFQKISVLKTRCTTFKHSGLARTHTHTYLTRNSSFWFVL